MKSFTEKSVLPADPGHHGAQLSEDESSRERKKAARGPHSENKKRRFDFLRDYIRIDKDAGADDSANNDHRCIEEIESAGELRKVGLTGLRHQL
jgi:hypothetical protein